jgi:Flp pilus assembly protein TadD
MQCPICDSPAAEGRAACLVCHAALPSIPPGAEKTKPTEWLTEILRRTFYTLLIGVLAGIITLLYLSFGMPHPNPENEPPVWMPICAVICGAIIGGGLGIIVPALHTTLRRRLLKGRLASLQRRAQTTLNGTISACQKNPDSSECHSQLAAAHYLAGDNTRALAAIEKALDSTPKDPVAMHNRAIIYASQNRLMQAQDDFGAARALGAEESILDLNQMLALTVEGVSKETAEACRRMWGRTKNLPDHANALAAYLLEAGFEEDAVSCIQANLENEPENVEAHTNLGVLRFRQGDLQGACEQFTLACHQERFPGWAHHNAGICALLRGEIVKAETLFGQVLHHDPDRAATLGQLAAMHALKNHSRRAVEELHEASRYAPGDFEIRHNLARVLHQEGKLEEAYIEAERAIELRPDEHDAMVNLAATGYQVKKYRVALEHSIRATQLFCDSAPARYNLACLLEAQERYAEATEQLAWLVEFFPRFTAAWNNLGAMRLLLGQTNEAIDALSHARSANLEDTRIRSNLALAYYIQGDLTAATREIETAGRQLEHSHCVLDIMGHIHSEKKRIPEAITAWAPLAAQETTNVEVLTNLGIAYFRDDQPDNAIDMFRKVLLLLPRSLVTHNHLGIAYAKNKLLSEAMHHLSKVVEMLPDNPVVHSNIGLVEYFRGQTEAAMGHWREVSRISPEYARRREATRFSHYDDSEMVVMPINVRRRAILFPPEAPSLRHEPRLAVHQPRFIPLLPWPELSEVYRLQGQIEALERRIH